MFKQEIVITPDTSDIRVSRQLSTRLQQWQNKTLQKLRQVPGAVKRPVRWTPAKNQNKPPNTRWGYYSAQKAKFFATNGFRRGIPTRRTGKLSQGWQVDLNIQQINRLEAYTADLLRFLTELVGGTPPIPPAPSVWITVDNPVDYEEYVTGTHQQGFHQDTGWFYAPDVLNTAFREVEGILSDL